jgi:hypothetical protein
VDHFQRVNSGTHDPNDKFVALLQHLEINPPPMNAATRDIPTNLPPKKAESQTNQFVRVPLVR